MSYEELLYKILRFDNKRANLLYDEASKKNKLELEHNLQIVDLLTKKMRISTQISQQNMMYYMFIITSMAHNKNKETIEMFEELKSLPISIRGELIGILSDKDIVNLLKNFNKEFTQMLIEQCILTVKNSNTQISLIKKYQSKIKNDYQTYESFYYAVTSDAREVLKELYGYNKDEEKYIKLKNTKDEEFYEYLKNKENTNISINFDEILKLILLKIDEKDQFLEIIKLYKEEINTCSKDIFILMCTRYMYISNTGLKDLYLLFKEKFNSIDLDELLQILREKDYEDEIVIDIITSNNNLNTIKVGNKTLDKFLTKEHKVKIYKKLRIEYSNKNYSYEELEEIINNIDLDEYLNSNLIKAVEGIKQLINNKQIDKKDKLYLELRNKFIKIIYNRIKKDNTVEENISLNRIFDRVINNRLKIEDVLKIENYKGIIYINKTEEYCEYADEITTYFSDEIIKKLNITPLTKAIKQVIEQKKHPKNFVIRMGLQLYSYFGLEKAIYMLNSDLSYTKLEYIFDNLDYKNIPLDEKGNPINYIANKKLFDYLFARGLTKTQDSVINKLLRGELEEFERYFSRFCKDYKKYIRECNGVVTVNRIIEAIKSNGSFNYLKPDEQSFKKGLSEISNNSRDVIEEAISLLKDARERPYSTIPKVKGQEGQFRYEILDLDDSLNIAVGYLSRCCFVVNGLSYESLKHALQSKNGRIFVVYYNNRFICQSWIWRNGDVVCFDSVEARSSYGEKEDNIGLKDIYIKVAEEIIKISKENEEEQERVKLVTVGNSDYSFPDLEQSKNNVKPIEKDLYLDSRYQKILAGKVDNIRLGEVKAKYKDERKVLVITDYNEKNIEQVAYAVTKVNELRYRIYGIEEPIDIIEYQKLIVGKDWYLIINNNGKEEFGLLNDNEDAKNEIEEYLREKGNQYIKRMENK